ncbi:MAG: hypothetical protein R3300_03635, partial [Candidatus Promineifilaceae bacterium]|nr:hypothetical protein [Candidatus Promineifilaceae bacterium]
MKRKLTIMAAVVMALTLLTVLIAAADAHLATVSVGHGIPGDDLGMDTALPVDVDVNGACAIEGLEFGEFYDLGMVPPGTYSVTVHVVVSETEPVCSGPAA